MKYRLKGHRGLFKQAMFALVESKFSFGEIGARVKGSQNSSLSILRHLAKASQETISGLAGIKNRSLGGQNGFLLLLPRV